MNKILRLLLLIVGFQLASCSGESDSSSANNSIPQAAPILRFQSSSEELRLPLLQVAQNVYTDVALRLAADGNWQLTSVGPMRPLSSADNIDAVLTAPGDVVVDRNWLPADSTILIRRLHIDTKVYGSVSLRLTGTHWSWVSELHELSALTLADFKANPTLVATDTHHTVLHSTPDSGMQRYPMQLKAKIYKFCMDRQEDGADTMSLLDVSGQTLMKLRAGDPCVSVKLDAGAYTMQHEYGGTGARRTLFVRPAAKTVAAPAPAQASLKSARPRTALMTTSATAYPEYAAIFVRAASPVPAGQYSDGFLSFNSTQPYPPAAYCRGYVDAGAQLFPFWRGYYNVNTVVLHHLFEGINFFQITRGTDGNPSGFGLPLACTNGGGSGYVYSYDVFEWTFRIDKWFGVDWPILQMFDATTFQLSMFTGLLSFFDSDSLSTNPTQDITTDRSGTLQPNAFVQPFRIAYRYFPNGLPPSMRTGSGWALAPGEVALFGRTDCTGTAMISVNWWVPQVQPPSDIGSFYGSLLLGPDTAVTAYTGPYATGQPTILNELGCLPMPSFVPAGGSLGIPSIDTAQMVISTNQCVSCNLAGVDLSNRDLSGVNLHSTNLTQANLSNSNLSRADLSSATLQGARLNLANLELANMSGAFLNAYAGSTAASLSGAHLKNANLDRANMDGADFSYASFYGAASAQSASMNNTNFNNAYLAGLNLSSATGNGANFSGAILIGANLNNADFRPNGGTGAPTYFNGAFLQGADFTNAKVSGARFTNAYVETATNNSSCTMQLKLNQALTAFTGFTVPKTPVASPPVCVASQPPTLTCVQTPSYDGHVARPTTDSTNTCPDGSSGPCTDVVWTSPNLALANNSGQLNSTCGAAAPLCGKSFIPQANVCW